MPERHDDGSITFSYDECDLIASALQEASEELNDKRTERRGDYEPEDLTRIAEREYAYDRLAEGMAA